MPFIYIVRHARDIYKIGFTTDPQSRIQAIRSTNPSATLHNIYAGEKQDEKNLHTIFASKKVSNEWFHLDEEDLSHIEGYFRKMSPWTSAKTFKHLAVSLLKCAVNDYVSPAMYLKTKAMRNANVEITEDEATAIQGKPISPKTFKIIKSFWLLNKDMTYKQIAYETGYALRTVDKIVPILRKLNQ